MAIRVAAWNLEGRLTTYLRGNRGQPHHILQEIGNINPDVAIFSEAYVNTPDDMVNETLHEWGYEWHDTPYHDIDRDAAEVGMFGEPHMRVVSKLPIINAQVHRFGNVRNMITFEVQDPETEQTVLLLGTHLDDRTEASRLQQIDEIIEYLDAKTQPIIMLGDFNAMWPKGRALVFRSKLAHALARRIPKSLFRSAAVRLAEMAQGSTMMRLHSEAKLVDVDHFCRSTSTPKLRDVSYLPAIPLIHIDHILISPTLKAHDYRVEKDGGSDHRAISATIRT